MKSLLFLIPLAAFAGVADHPDVTAAERLFESWIRGQMAYRGLPGIAVGVVADQELVWAKGFGYADVDKKIPVTPATKFRMASHSKLFAATSVMQLREKGRVRLDDPVSKHLPWFTMRPAEPGDAPVTVEELLTHASGLPREAGPHWSDYNFPDDEGLKKYVAEHQAIYAPQVRFKYSNLAYSLAGKIVEAVSGMKFGDYVQKNIYDPLGMKNSSVDRNEPDLAVGYGRRMPDGTRKKMPFVDARSMAAATGITSTVEDMAKFVALQFRKGQTGGAQILNTASLREMHRVRMLENNWTRGNAIGFAVNRDKDKLYVGHGGSYPGYKTQTTLQLDDKVGVIVLTNGDDSNPGDLAQRLMETVGEAVAKAAKPAEKPMEWDPSWKRFVGVYRNAFSDSEIVELNNRLVLFDPSSPNPTQQTKLIPIGGGRFRMEAPSGGGAVGEIVRFVEENGRVVRMYSGDSFLVRVNP